MGHEAICDDLMNTAEDKPASGLKDICTVQVNETKVMPSAGC